MTAACTCPRRLHLVCLQLLAVLLAATAPYPCVARPEIMQEQLLSTPWAFGKGAYVGYQTLLSLLGYYEEEETIRYDDVAYEDIVHPAAPEERTTIQLVGLGLARTGSTSLVMALEQLGYSAVHDDEQVELGDLYYYWEEDVIDGDQFHDILGQRGYNATFKTADYKWVAKRPHVKAILTMRDSPESYVQSYLTAAPFVEMMHMFPFRYMPTVQGLQESFDAEWKVETTGGRPEEYLNPDVLGETYVDYNQAVQTAIPAERLLTFNVKEGWAPLCDFLGVPIPADLPFPHVHTQAKLQGEMFFLHAVIWISRIALVLLGVAHVKILAKLLDALSPLFVKNPRTSSPTCGNFSGVKRS
mmetsp:Transcript_11240/g.31747  ORF Transcript_11240/g.31747 Transcript_11240/m.31747 type:complete len:357 (-) Transcript_11240:488-1558(-)